MSTYVSQLKQQTGIVLSSDSQWGSKSLTDIFSVESSAEPIPLIEEYHQVEVSQPTHSVSPTVQGQPEPVKEPTASISTISGDSTSEHHTVSAPETITGSLTLHDDRVASEAASTSIVEQHEIQIADVSSPPSHQKQPKHNLKPTKETISSTIPSKAIETRVESVTTQPAADAPMTAHYLRAVRDWVAETPVVQEEILVDEVHEVTAERSIPSQLPQNATKPIVINDRSSPLMQERDFTLSIGSIHLTVTAPPPETKPPPVVPDRVAPTSNAETFRLSRHYLRFR